MFWAVICHMVGDYMLQSDYAASVKTTVGAAGFVDRPSRLPSWLVKIVHNPSVACLSHVLLYVLPFLFLTRSLPALAFIAGTHFVIDRWRLARYVCWAKNWLAPPGWNQPWSECSGTGYTKDKPVWLAVWLLIIVDNTMHVICNAIALQLLVGA